MGAIHASGSQGSPPHPVAKQSSTALLTRSLRHDVARSSSLRKTRSESPASATRSSYSFAESCTSSAHAREKLLVHVGLLPTVDFSGALVGAISLTQK